MSRTVERNLEESKKVWKKILDNPVTGSKVVWLSTKISSRRKKPQIIKINNKHYLIEELG